MKVPQKTLERKYLESGYDLVIGVDEVGMGCLAGPVVVCAVAFDKKFFEKSHHKLHWLRDSKLLLPKKREEFAAQLWKDKNLRFKICYCFPKTIDKINIYQAARKAMKRAVNKVSGFRFQVLTNKKNPLQPKSYNLKTVVLVDGKTKIAGLKFDQQAIIKGDRKVFAIACASILAKVFRDKMIRRYAKKFPGYGFEKHKGYGTKEHLIQLKKLGPCAIHRFSFAPVAKLS